MIFSHRNTLQTRLLNLSFIVLIALSVSSCGKSEVELCIDKQSHLWDNTTNDKKANKAYWDAVSKCKQS